MSTHTPKPLVTAKGGDLLHWPAEIGLTASIMEKVETRRTKIRRRRTVRAAAAAALLLVLVVIPFFRHTSTLTVPVASRQTFTLSDGSTAELNAQSAVSTDFRFGRRKLRLERGEAFLRVVPDAEHPFQVETPRGTIRVLGTSFNIRVREDGETDVTLIEGSIALESPRGKVQLRPGQQGGTADAVVRDLAPHQIEAATAWRQGKFAFEGLTLAEAAARLDMFHGRRISVSPEVAKLEAAGNFPVDDLPAILSALEMALGIRVQALSDGSYSITAR